jgi:hypothetical protein
LWPNACQQKERNNIESVREECATLANAVPSKDRETLVEMAREWERLADQQQRASDLGPKE